MIFAGKGFEKIQSNDKKKKNGEPQTVKCDTPENIAIKMTEKNNNSILGFMFHISIKHNKHYGKWSFPF